MLSLQDETILNGGDVRKESETRAGILITKLALQKAWLYSPITLDSVLVTNPYLGP